METPFQTKRKVKITLAISTLLVVAGITTLVLVNSSPMSESDQGLCEKNKESVTPEMLRSYDTEFAHLASVKFDDRCNPTFNVTLATNMMTINLDLAKTLLLEKICMSFTTDKENLPTTTDRVTYNLQNIQRFDLGSIVIKKTDCVDVEFNGQLN